MMLWRNYSQSDPANPKTIRAKFAMSAMFGNWRRQLPSILKRLVMALMAWHGPETLVTFKLLRSMQNVGDQNYHEDCPDMGKTKPQSRPTNVAQFSGMIGYEEKDTKIGAKKGGDIINDIIIDKGHLAIWKGTFKHRGSDYTGSNQYHYRIFICIGSVTYPMSEFVLPYV